VPCNERCWQILTPFGLLAAIWYILWPFGTFCGLLVYFSRFGMLCREKSGNPAWDQSLCSSFHHFKTPEVGF
jgi:hypothetical protein